MPFCNAYEHRLAQLRGSGARVMDVDSAALSGGDLAQIAPVLTAAGLTFDAELTRRMIDRADLQRA